MAAYIDRREVWVGNPIRFGILQRLGIGGFFISLGLVSLAFNAPGDARIRYWLFVSAHTLLYIGFVVAAVADRLAYRRFSYGRPVYAAFMGIAYLVIGPVVMAAAAAVVRT